MEKINFESFEKLPFVHSLKLNDSASKAVYAITMANVENNCYDTNLWVYDLKAESHYQLTSSNKEQSFYFIDDNTILFKSSRDESNKKDNDKKVSKFYQIKLTGGEAKLAFEIELSVSKIEKISENKFLILASKFTDRDDGYHLIDRLPIWMNGAGYTYDQVNDLYIYDNENNQTEKISLEDITQVENFKYSKEKNLVLYSYSTEITTELFNHINIYSINDKRTNKLSKDGFNHSFFDFCNDKIIFAGSDMKTYGINEDSKIWTMNIDGSDHHMISKENFDMSLFNSTGSDLRYGGGAEIKVVHDKLYFIATNRDKAHLYAMDLVGNIEEVITDKNSVEMFDYNKDTLIYTAIDGLSLAEIYIRKQDKDEKISEYSEKLSKFELLPIEHFTFESDGNELDGYVIKPSGYKEGEKYPGLLEIHGGPKTAYSSILHHEMQLLAQEGYFVFFTNPRGSSGRGVKFSDIRGKYGTIDYDDLMTFTDEVINRYPDLDEDHLGVLGGSYGGFMTNWIIGHTDRFKAANTQRSISNWTSFYGVSDIGFYFAEDQNQSTPWNDFDLLWESSPLKHFNNVKTPTLVIHSDEDFRCPLEQGLQVFNALKVLGVDTRLAIFNGENHELSRSGKPKNRIKRLEEIVSWFNKYLKKERHGKNTNITE